MDDKTPFVNSILTFWQHTYFARKHDSKLNLIGEFLEQQKGGHLHPSLQELLNKHQRGLIVCFRQLSTFTLPASHEKDRMLQKLSSATDLVLWNTMIPRPSVGQCSHRCFFIFLPTAVIPGSHSFILCSRWPHASWKLLHPDWGKGSEHNCVVFAAWMLLYF